MDKNKKLRGKYSITIIELREDDNRRLTSFKEPEVDFDAREIISLRSDMRDAMQDYKVVKTVKVIEQSDERVATIRNEVYVRKAENHWDENRNDENETVKQAMIAHWAKLKGISIEEAKKQIKRRKRTTRMEENIDG